MTSASNPGLNSDRIELRGLRVAGVVGVLPEERTRAQPIEIDVDLEVDLRSAGRTDDLADTVDYGAICDLMADTVARLRPQLLERLATELALAALAHDHRIDLARVAVRKLRPPVPHLLDSSGVVVTRGRDR